jgi:hypothetical protein
MTRFRWCTRVLNLASPMCLSGLITTNETGIERAGRHSTTDPGLVAVGDETWHRQLAFLGAIRQQALAPIPEATTGRVVRSSKQACVGGCGLPVHIRRGIGWSSLTPGSGSWRRNGQLAFLPRPPRTTQTEEVCKRTR